MKSLDEEARSRVLALDVFAELPIAGDQELLFQATGYRSDHDRAVEYPGWGFFADLGYRLGAFVAYVSHERFDGDEARTRDSQTWRAGLGYHIDKRKNHVKAEVAHGRGHGAPESTTLTVQWNFVF